MCLQRNPRNRPNIGTLLEHGFLHPESTVISVSAVTAPPIAPPMPTSHEIAHAVQHKHRVQQNNENGPEFDVSELIEFDNHCTEVDFILIGNSEAKGCDADEKREEVPTAAAARHRCERIAFCTSVIATR